MLETRERIRDGEKIVQAQCPNRFCGQWADVDEDQLAGRVSLICEQCGWHGMIDRDFTP